MTVPSLVIALLAAVVVFAGCESTQDESARLKAAGGDFSTGKKVDVKKQSGDVEVLDTAIVEDQNGGAAVIKLKNDTKQGLIRVPISFSAKNKAGKEVFANNEPGLDVALTSISYVPTGEAVYWIHDQLLTSEPASKLDAKIGAPTSMSSKPPPEIVIKNPKIHVDEVDGTEIVGRVSNQSKILQEDLIIYSVALKGSKVVAAGRAAITRLKPGKSKPFRAFVIGNPKGAKLVTSAPPTTFQ